MIIEKVDEAKRRKIKVYPVNSNRASDLGHPCTRYHVLNRTRWEEKSPHDVGLQYVFDMGNYIEELVLKELAEAGVKVIEQQRSFQWKEYQITGHIDGSILGDDGNVYPLEIKSCSPFMFKAINAIEDLKRGKYLYMRKYPVQLNLYLLMDGKERGVFIFKDKTSGRMKEVWMDVDFEMGESSLKMAEAVNTHVAAGTIPECMPYDESVCGDCPFIHICLPEHTGKEVEIVDSQELIDLIERYNELKPLAKEYDEIDEQIKKVTEGHEKILAGDWFITGKWAVRTVYNVPPDVKQQYKGESRYWKRSIVRAV